MCFHVLRLRQYLWAAVAYFDSLRDGTRCMHAPTPDLRTRLELGHALTQWCADGVDVRILHVKGLAAERVIPLGDEGTSNDVDVIVDPAGAGDVLQAFRSVASATVVDDVPAGARGHAISVVSRGVDVSVDLHLFFPGFRASHARVFDELWSSAEEISLGGWKCRAPDRVGCALIALVHAARNPPSSRAHRQALERWSRLTRNEQKRVRQLTESLDARAAIHSVLGKYPDANRFEVALYRSHQTRTGGGARWLLTFLSAPSWTERWDILRRSIRSRIVPSRPVSVEIGRSAPDEGGVWRRMKRGSKSLLSGMHEVHKLLSQGKQDG